jgi:hypothetical protein
VIRSSGDATTTKVREQLIAALCALLPVEPLSSLAAETLAFCSLNFAPAERDKLYEMLWEPTYAANLMLCAFLLRARDQLLSLVDSARLEQKILAALADPVEQNTLLAVGILSFYVLPPAAAAAAPTPVSPGPASSSHSAGPSAASVSAAAHCIPVLPHLLGPLVAILKTRSDPVRLGLLDLLKRAMKRDGSVCLQLTKQLAPVLMELIKDRKSLPVKMAAERTLLHLLQLKTERTKFASHMAQLSAEEVKTITDYVKRVLLKVAQAASDDELTDDLDDPLRRYTQLS